MSASNDKLIDTIAFLLEFYHKDMLDRFLYTCDNYDNNMGEALQFLKDRVMQRMSIEKTFPDFMQVVGLYARTKAIDPNEFKSRFVLPRGNN